MSARALAVSTRTQIITRLMACIADEVADKVRWPDRVQVLDHDPGGDRLTEALFVVDVRGTRPADLLSGGATQDQITGDDFIVTLVGIARAPGLTFSQARDRVDEFYAAVSLVVNGAAYESSLGDFTLDDDRRPVWLTEFATVDGPWADPSGDAGHVGFVRLDVRIATLEGVA